MAADATPTSTSTTISSRPSIASYSSKFVSRYTLPFPTNPPKTTFASFSHRRPFQITNFLSSPDKKIHHEENTFISRFAPDEPRKGCNDLVEALEREGGTDVFAYPVGASMEIHQALTRSKTIRNVLPRHEQGGIFAAEGYAHASGLPGVYIATSGPTTQTLLADKEKGKKRKSKDSSIKSPSSSNVSAGKFTKEERMKVCRCINNTPSVLKMQIYNVLDLHGLHTSPGYKTYVINKEENVKISDFEKQIRRASNGVQMHIFINGTIRMELSPKFFKDYDTLIFEMDGDNPVVKGIVRRKHETKSQGNAIYRIMDTFMSPSS